MIRGAVAGRYHAGLARISLGIGDGTAAFPAALPQGALAPVAAGVVLAR